MLLAVQAFCSANVWAAQNLHEAASSLEASHQEGEERSDCWCGGQLAGHTSR